MQHQKNLEQTVWSIRQVVSISGQVNREDFFDAYSEITKKRHRSGLLYKPNPCL